MAFAGRGVHISMTEISTTALFVHSSTMEQTMGRLTASVWGRVIRAEPAKELASVQRLKRFNVLGISGEMDWVGGRRRLSRLLFRETLGHGALRYRPGCSTFDGVLHTMAR
jgi:hypothetical protein